MTDDKLHGVSQETTDADVEDHGVCRGPSTDTGRCGLSTPTRPETDREVVRAGRCPDNSFWGRQRSRF